MLEPWGDKMVKNSTWPAVERQGRIRIYAQNLNGVLLERDVMEWEMILDHIHKQQIDIACFSKMNIDITKPLIQHSLNEKAKKLDRYCKIIHAD